MKLTLPFDIEGNRISTHQSKKSSSIGYEIMARIRRKQIMVFNFEKSVKYQSVSRSCYVFIIYIILNSQWLIQIVHLLHLIPTAITGIGHRNNGIENDIMHHCINSFSLNLKRCITFCSKSQWKMMIMMMMLMILRQHKKKETFISKFKTVRERERWTFLFLNRCVFAFAANVRNG